MVPDALAATIRRLEHSVGALATQGVARMDENLPWFRALAAEQRSWVALIVQAGLTSFVNWLRDPAPPHVIDNVFGVAPPEMVRTISLQQALQIVKVAVEIAEEQTPRLAASGEEPALREAVLRYSREVAFAAAEVYARAAEDRGAWDSRLQAMLVDALIRDAPTDTLASQAAALGWTDVSPVAVAIASARSQLEVATDGDAVRELSRAGRKLGVDVLASVHGDRLVVVIGGHADPLAVVEQLLPQFGSGPVVVGPTVASVAEAATSARAADAGARAAIAWPQAPRPVAAVTLLPERVLAGDREARRVMRDKIFVPLQAGGSTLLQTLEVYLGVGGSIEGAARALFVHPNTIRYRLRRISELCGLAPTDPRDAFTLHMALALGRLHVEEN